MASQNPNPTTPAKVPASAANYTPATQDTDLRSKINLLLINNGHVNKIQDHLLHSLHAHPSNWPTLIQNHALTLMRSGECTTFPALLKRVIEDVKSDTNFSSTSSRHVNGVNGTNGTDDGVNGKAMPNGTAASEIFAANGNTNGTITAASPATNGTINAHLPGSGSNGTSLALPQSVIEDALKITRECLDTVAEVVEPDDEGGEGEGGGAGINAAT
ncbi:hypothetical protein QBC46DRAFT_373843 [Diplogelasinospora grovesii]|uniref:Uncharacterized protein n=1 Tax=Diplogelasinospora grovesii TaxID=303347 RepID=A0AAN6S8Q0_9PEZI|nr:hypothetical protein QBC46DRAFT_373843 [Diplogelasinospora grovesii]